MKEGRDNHKKITAVPVGTICPNCFGTKNKTN
jgi:hypothetical protein